MAAPGFTAGSQVTATYGGLQPGETPAQFWARQQKRTDLSASAQMGAQNGLTAESQWQAGNERQGLSLRDRATASASPSAAPAPTAGTPTPPPPAAPQQAPPETGVLPSGGAISGSSGDAGASPSTSALAAMAGPTNTGEGAGQERGADLNRALTTRDLPASSRALSILASQRGGRVY